jgi:uncharacterized surface protein with fasciclin (FAS1) repeats
MLKIKPIILPLLFVLILFFSCRDDMEVDKYARPDWLAGKLYTQILEQPELSTFAKCVELTGYDSVINISGSYTVFAPTNEAFDLWLAQNSNYSSVENIPLDELTRIVKYHIIQNRWSKKDLRSLDIYGWIDTLDINNDKPRGYKRETLLKEPNRKLGLGNKGGKAVIVDTLNTNNYRRTISDSRKYAPLFYQEYFNIYNLSSNDYQFYFNRSFEGGDNLYYANGKLISDEIFADNGFIFMIDQVVEPLRSAYQILENENGPNSYSDYLDLVNYFPEFDFNKNSTFDQEGADLGIKVDSLYDLDYPELTFNIYNEKTQPPKGITGLTSNVAVRYHNGLTAPTNSALNALDNEYLKISNGWGGLENAPSFIKRIIINSHMSFNPVYPSDYEKGFLNGEGDMVKIDENNIVHKEYGSNSTFIGLSKAIVPKAFSSITGAVYLRRGFSKIMYAIEKADLLPLMKLDNNDYMFFVESDGNTEADSSFLYDPFIGSGIFSVWETSTLTQSRLTTQDLRTLLLNHVAIRNPKGAAKKEFIPNLAGNYVIINNETGEVSGTNATTKGYSGAEIVHEFPKIISEASNGKTFEINNWFSFGGASLYVKLSSQFPAFHALLVKAGLAIPAEFRYNFLSDSEFYTVFAPTQAAIENAGLNSLTVEELRQVLLLHFVQGDLIFTDGNKNANYYDTGRVDEKSTPFSTVYSKLYVEPGVDFIRFKNKNGVDYTTINESELTNLFTSLNINTGDAQQAFPSTFTNAVIHEIDKVLIFEELDTQ